ncbi:MAG: ATP-binding protein [Candidatus Omnitrophica bacterium]|nr:ATP-binding protein [Candidatus Omnitrophota bacterium]
MAKQYIARDLGKIILRSASEFPVVALTGPRQTGKSTLLKRTFPSFKHISFDDALQRQLAAKDPRLFIGSLKPPVILDEMQYVPEILPCIKQEVDQNRDKNGQYILTGSQIFNVMSGLSETLSGRVALFELLGFSLPEMSKIEAIKRSPDKCFEMLFGGFYPEVAAHKADINSFYGSYIHTYLERDIRQIRSVHDIRLFQQFLELIAARAGGLLNLSEISKECGISHTTAQNWLTLLESTRIVYLLRPYHKNTTKRVIKSPKIYFTDTGLLAYILRYPDPATLMSGAASGAIFENFMVIEALKNKFNTNSRYELYFYRDSNHNEVDLILDSGHMKKLFEFKTAKTLRPDHWAFLSKGKTVFDKSDAFLVSLSEEKTTLEKGIHSIPWWDFPSQLN